MVRPPSSEHEDLLELLRHNPRMALELARPHLQRLPRFTQVEAVSEALTQPRPAQLRPDLIHLLRDGEANRLALLIEVQRRRDGRKRSTWPLYEVMARNRYGCDTLLLVLATNERTARWANEPIPLGNGGSIQPLVLSPGDIPLVTDRAEAEASPERAVLACILHAEGDPVEVATAALIATEAAVQLPEPRGRLYIDFIERHLTGKALDLWRTAFMSATGYQWRGSFALKHREEGREEGRVEQARQILTEQCELRFGPLPEWAARRISAGSLDALSHWTRRVVLAERLEDVFSP